ncbi:hypothetical protein ANTQUA_LOCUS3480 [Anthophora quadrimaculata]
MCFRIEAFEIQNCTTVAYSTWDYRRNATTQEFSVVLVLRIELRLFHLFRAVVVARCASDTCFRIEALEIQNSTAVAYSIWYYRPNAAIQEFSGVIELRIELRLYYLPRTVVVARYASGMCFRIEAFEIQDCTSVAYSIWDYRRNATIQVFAVVIVLKAFEIQNSTTVAYETWDYRRNATILEFSVVIVLRIELRLCHRFSTVVVARCVFDTCFRIEAFEIQNSTTVAYETWDYRRNATVHEFSVVIELRIELRLCHRFSTVVVARCASGSCFRIEAFVIQNSTTVAYETWDYRRNTRIQEFSVVIVLRIKLRLFYLSRTVVVARCASETCCRLEALENQQSTTFAS